MRFVLRLQFRFFNVTSPYRPNLQDILDCIPFLSGEFAIDLKLACLKL